MNFSLKSISLILLYLAVSALNVAAQSATLTWDPNNEPEVTGYNIYYRTDTPTFPFNGTTLAEGPSPIYVAGADSTSLTVDLPNDGKIYYFSATAISNTSLESSYSDIIASEWVPHLVAPYDDQSVSPSPTFVWDQAPSGYNVTYELYYGTDPLLPLNAALLPPAKDRRTDASNDGETLNATHSSSPFSYFWALPLAILATLLTSRRPLQRKSPLSPLKIGFCIGLLALQAACGGSGGTENTGTSNVTIDSPLPSVQAVTVVTDINSTSYQLNDLEPETQYYWKIVAVDDTGYRFESVTQSFTTSAY